MRKILSMCVILAAFFMSMISMPSVADNFYGTRTDNSSDSKQGNNPNIEVDPGMELRRVGGLNMIVPKGTQVHQDGSLQVMEGPDEYAARNIMEVKTRIGEMEKAQKEMREEVDSLKEAILKLQENK